MQLLTVLTIDDNLVERRLALAGEGRGFVPQLDIHVPFIAK